ncbi:hypothetical protein FB45DRAFT_936630 [Roridomyces roridus]|uniref:Uncharacterized protein n=1 Tax=Roridomyces roridus TaxID=1738132 RepID=A0AAD7B967_9AGAR|nr:hypothetical protein FB45DRAFT_936630 [Roridomyces roridus]
MGAASAPQSQTFPIGAAVAAGTFVILAGLTVVVFAQYQKHGRTRKPPGDVEAGAPTADAAKRESDFSARADGSTIDIPSPATERRLTDGRPGS